jgi:NADPH-dependent ferric siderophore reductase
MSLLANETLTDNSATHQLKSCPPNVRPLRVVGVADVTPRMRRVTLSGPDLTRFDADEMHVKILIPRRSGEPVWPGVSPSGQAILDSCDLIRRTYTIRRVELAAGTLDIDFVLHGETSPGSRFATRARPGDWLGIMGPAGIPNPAEGWQLIAGDETGLPVIGRTLERMRPDERGLVLIEVADAEEEQDITRPPGVELRWLHRNGAAYGAKLAAAVRAAEWPEEETVSAWAACETRAARAIREHWRQERGLPETHHRAVGYWRQEH